MLPAHREGIDQLDPKSFRQMSHRRHELVGAEMPDLDRQVTLVHVAQDGERDPRGRERRTAGDHDDARAVQGRRTGRHRGPRDLLLAGVELSQRGGPWQGGAVVHDLALGRGWPRRRI